MKKLIILALLALTLVSCAEKQTIEGKTYGPYGLVSKDDDKDPAIRYEVSMGSIVVAVIFCATIVAPIYIFGWDLYEPISKK